jgi:hypothetical protein
VRPLGWGLAATGLGAVAWWGLSRTAPAPPPEAPPTVAQEPEPSERRPILPVVEPTPGPWHEWNRLALEALEAGELEKAVELLTAAWEMRPEDPVLGANLAESLARLARALHRTGGATEAVLDQLTRAVDLAPERADLAHMLARWMEEARLEGGFRLEETDHFEFRYDGERRDLLTGGVYDLSQQLEAAYQNLGEFFGTFPVEAGGGKVRVVLYRREEFGDVGGLGDWVAGLFDGTVRLPVEDLAGERARLRDTLRHELVHVFTHRVGGGKAPGWLDEGLAQWLEGEARGTREGALFRARQTLSGQELHAWDTLSGSLASWADGEAVARAYAQSLLLVDHLARQYGERLVLQLVEGCGRGLPPEATFRDQLQLDLWETVAAEGL